MIYVNKKTMYVYMCVCACATHIKHINFILSTAYNITSALALI